MSNENPLQNVPSGDSVDIFGASGLAKYLANPIIRGIGKSLEPVWDRLHNKAKIADFNAWDEALKLRGYAPQSVQLTLGQRAEVQMLAKAIEHQNNSEAIAVAAIEHAEHEFDPGDTLNVPSLDATWLDQFWKLAQDISDADMQAFWGAVLSRASTGKGTVSPRALNLLTTLTSSEAHAIERLATMTIRVETMPGQWNAGLLTRLRVMHPIEVGSPLADLDNNLRPIVGNYERDLFSSIGLYLEEGFAHDFIQAPFPDRENVIEFSIGSTKFAINGDFPSDEYGNYPLGNGTGLSPLGGEIFGMVNAKANPAYVEIISKWCKLIGCELKQL